jgi:hypothetical protein
MLHNTVIISSNLQAPTVYGRQELTWNNETCVIATALRKVYTLIKLLIAFQYSQWKKLQRFSRIRKICQKKKKSIGFVISLCPSAWNNSAPPGRIFMKCRIFLKSV